MIPSAFTFYKPDNIEKAVSLMADLAIKDYLNVKYTHMGIKG